MLAKFQSRLFSLAACLVPMTLAVSASAACDDVDSLALAAKRNDREAVRSLLAKYADANDSQVDGTTALHWATYHDDREMAKWLIDAGADVRRRNRYGVQPLSLACRNGNAAMAGLLLDAGADPNGALRGGETVLMTAARTGRVGVVEELLARGAEVDTRERKGQTALMWAAAEGHADAVDALLEAGADFRVKLGSGFTAFFFAVREGKSDVVLRLLEAGVDVNAAIQPEEGSARGPRAGISPLTLAVENGHFELAEFLLRNGAKPNDKRCGYGALHAICWVRKPLRGDGDPPPIGSGKTTSLEFVRQMAAHGADLNIKHGSHRAARGRLNRTGATPLLLAAETADVPLMRLFVELGADPKASNAEDCTPLLAAAGIGVLSDGDEAAGTESEAIAAIQFLLALGADINAVDAKGESAMHGAAYKSRPQLVKFLADRGAEVRSWNHKNKFGWTPLMIAEGHRPGNFRPHPETIDAIQQIMRESKDDSRRESANDRQ